MSQKKASCLFVHMIRFRHLKCVKNSSEPLRAESSAAFQEFSDCLQRMKPENETCLFEGPSSLVSVVCTFKMSF
jgi:hypothetical protein